MNLNKIGTALFKKGFIRPKGDFYSSFKIDENSRVNYKPIEIYVVY